jgi:hypothetical protein
MKQQRQPKFKGKKNFDYNMPFRKCTTCYTISAWHCYDCGADFCESHFQDHKERKLCAKLT